MPEKTKLVLNPITGQLDLITTLDSTTLPSGSDNYIQNTSTLQAGATFHTASGTIDGALTAGAASTVTNAAVSGTPGTPFQINTGDPNTKGLIIKGNTYVPAGELPNTIANLKAWYKADSLSLNDGDAISTWADSSGNGFDASSTLTARPLYKVNIVNGKPAILFDGSDDGFTAAITSVGTRSITCFVVYKTSNAATQQVFISSKSSTAAIFQQSSSKLIVYDAPTSALATDTNWHVVGYTCNASGTTYYKDGVTEAQTAMTNATVTLDRIGRFQEAVPQYSVNGYIAEIVLYSRVLGATEINNVQAYLGAKYGISITGLTVAQVSNLAENQNSSGTFLSGFDNIGRLILAGNAGTPTGTPTALTAVYDTTNNKLYVYNGGWKSVTLA